MSDRTVRICIIDDDEIYHYTIEKLISSTLTEVKIIPFTDAEEALETIYKNEKQDGLLSEIIFLDINMPYMNGWDFLEEYKKLDDKLKAQIDLYIVSSSIARYDIEKSKTYEDVKGFIHKPFSVEQLQDIIERKQEMQKNN